MYASVQGAFQYGVLAPFRRPPRDPAQLLQPQRHFPEIEEGDELAAGDGPHRGLRPQAVDRQRHNDRVYKRRLNAQREVAAPSIVETLRRADCPYTDDEMDSVRSGTEQNPSRVSHPENHEETQEEAAVADVHDTAASTTQTNTEAAKSDLDHSDRKQQKEKKSSTEDEWSRTGDTLESRAEGGFAPAEVQVSFSNNTENNHFFLHLKIAKVCNFTLMKHFKAPPLGTTLQLGTSAPGLKARKANW